MKEDMIYFLFNMKAGWEKTNMVTSLSTDTLEVRQFTGNFDLCEGGYRNVMISKSTVYRNFIFKFTSVLNRIF